MPRSNVIRPGGRKGTKRTPVIGNILNSLSPSAQLGVSRLLNVEDHLTTLSFFVIKITNDVKNVETKTKD